VIFRSAAIELPAVAFHPLTGIPAQSFIRRHRHLNDYINSEHLPAAARHYRALYIIILYIPVDRGSAAGPSPPRVDPPRRRRSSFSTVSGDPSNSNETGKTVSRHVLFYSFRKRNTHTRGCVRVQIDLSRRVPVQLWRGGWGRPCRRFSLSAFLYFLRLHHYRTTAARERVFCFD